MVNKRPVLKVGGKSNLISDTLSDLTIQWADMFERVSLKTGSEIVYSGMRSQFIYFPIDAVVSLVLSHTGDKKNEVTISVLGRGDMVCISALLGETPSAVTAIVDMGGSALRCSTQAARRLMDSHEPSRQAVCAYANVFQAESWQWMAAGVQLPVLARVAAYLLIYFETAGTDYLPVTHAMMHRRMSIRKASVTKATLALAEMGIIKQGDRGRIDVVDGPKLREYVRSVWPLYGTHRQAFLDALSA